MLTSLVIPFALAACSKGSSPTSPKPGDGMSAMNAQGPVNARPGRCRRYDGKVFTINTLEVSDNAGDAEPEPQRDLRHQYLDDPQDFH
jgi:hypothetical protein